MSRALQLALLSLALAALLMPALALGLGSIEAAFRQGFAIMAATFFVTLGLADLATRAVR